MPTDDRGRVKAGRGVAGLYQMSIDGCLDQAIGRHGLDAAALGAWCYRLEPHLRALRADAAAGRLAILSIVRDDADIAEAETALAALSAGARTIVFFGTGGSSLGGQTLAQIAGWHIPGGADQAQSGRPRTRFYDNLDPDTLTRALATIDLGSTRFVVISKSGNTPETLVQCIATLQAVKAAGLEREIPRLFLGLTEPASDAGRNGLRQLLESHAIPILPHHTGIGGRYSVLSNVGLLPAIARGLDVRAIRAGAAAVVDQLLAGGTVAAFAPALGAALSTALAKERGISIQVLMPYADRLQRLGAWFVQLWAESLGKSGKGTTPIACLGPLDQHSQLQLFMDGPRQHLVSVMRLATEASGPRIDEDLARCAGIEVMAGRTVGDLVAAQSMAVPEALGHAGRPVRAFDIERLDERTVGALLMHFMIETVLAGRLLGIDPFDQPAVELGKRLARERLAKSARG